MPTITSIDQFQDSILGTLFTTSGELILSNDAQFDVATTLAIVEQLNWDAMSGDVLVELAQENPIIKLAHIVYPKDQEYFAELIKTSFTDIPRLIRVLNQSRVTARDTQAATFWLFDILNTLIDNTIPTAIFTNMISPREGATALIETYSVMKNIHDDLKDNPEFTKGLMPREAFDAALEVFMLHDREREQLKSYKSNIGIGLEYQYTIMPNDIPNWSLMDLADKLLVDDGEGNIGIVDVHVSIPEGIELPEQQLAFKGDILPGSAASSIVTTIFMNRNAGEMPDDEAQLFFNYSYLFDLNVIMQSFDAFTADQKLEAMEVLAEMHAYAMMEGREPTAMQILNLVRHVGESDDRIVIKFIEEASDFMNSAEPIDGREHGHDGELIMIGSRVVDPNAFGAFIFRYMRDVALIGATRIPEGYFASEEVNETVFEIIKYFLPLEITALRSDITLADFTEDDINSGASFIELVNKEIQPDGEETPLQRLTQEYIDTGLIATEEQAQKLEAAWEYLLKNRKPEPRITEEPAKEETPADVQ